MEKRGTKAARETRRFRALALLKQGLGVCEVAKVVGVTAGAVSQWNSAYAARGEKGLRSKPHPGAKPKLGAADLRRLPELLVRGPTKHGFSTELWTLARVATVIERKFGVTYHPAHVHKILRKLGWSCQKPARLARERDDKLVEQWRTVEWPRIKKGLPERAEASS